MTWRRVSLVVAIAFSAACGSSGSSDPVPTCQADGSSCGAGKVCLSGACIAACVPDVTCTPSGTADPCKTYVTSCDANLTHTTCAAATTKADGATCGSGNVCLAGACIAACVPEVTCTPSGTADPCQVYLTTCDANLTHTTCAASSTKPNGATCGTGNVCSSGACIAACVPLSTCTPPPTADECRTYSTVCNATLTQGTCGATGIAPNGASCYTSGTCSAGVCRGGAAPVISPAGGSFPAGQTVTITADPAAVVYFTTDGTEPSNTQTVKSPAFTGGSHSVTLLSSTTIKAFAVLANKQSPTVSASFTIAPAPPPPPAIPNYPSGFAGSETSLQRNGQAEITPAARLELTPAIRNQVATAFYATPVDIRRFTTEFSFQFIPAETGVLADGITFTVQGSGPYAIGSLGGGLGYGPEPQAGSYISRIDRSVAVKFDTFDDVGEGNNSTGLYLDGAAPALPADPLPVSSVDLHSGHVFNVRLVYDGVNLTLTITDADGLHPSFTKSWPVDIPARVGGTTAYVGFTGATGAVSGTQDILTWTYSAP